MINRTYLQIFFISIFIYFYIVLPRPAYAEINLSNQTLVENTTWKATDGPYRIQGKLSIPKGISLKIDSGTDVYIEDASIDISGSLFVDASKYNPVKIHQTSESVGLMVHDGIINIKNIDMEGGKNFIDADSSSQVYIEDSIFEHLKGYSSSIAVHGSSSLSFINTTMMDIQSPQAVMLYDDIGTISGSVFDNAGTDTSIFVGTPSLSTSTINIKNTSFKNGNTAVQVYENASTYVSDSKVQNMSIGLQAFRNSTMLVENTEITNNFIGISSSRAKLTLLNSHLSKNSFYGYYIIGGLFGNKGNSLDSLDKYVNSALPLIVLEGDTTKPIATSTPCCSNVLFIPGLESSRLYKKEFTGENQLWEPNRNADVEKLFLDSNGKPKDKSIYTRDIINRTNIGLGIYDQDIYKGFTDHLDSLKNSGTIADWSFFAYDWRKPPEDIIGHDEQSEATFKNIESALLALASTSKTHKVTLVAHSYGGVLSKYLLRYLAEKKESYLVDNLILVAVPEQGTVESVGVLLHGDDHEIGDGYILSQSTARTLGLNMPSAYYLLPNKDLISYLGGVIKHADDKWFDKYLAFGKDLVLKTENSTHAFLVDSLKQRPYAPSVNNVSLPARLNDTLYKKAMKSRSADDIDNFVYSSSTKVFNIIGTGIDTVEGYQYFKEDCEDNDPFLTALHNDPYCGFDHSPIFTIKGDGTVLMGDMNKRWGNKFIFNLGVYNTSQNTNLAHADILNAGELLDAIDKILKNQENISSANITSYNENNSQVDNDDTLQYVIDDSMDIQVNQDLKSSGYIEKSDGKIIRKIRGTIPNSSYKHIGSKRYLVLKKAPLKIKIKPTRVSTKLDEFGDPKVSYFKLRVHKLKGVVGDKLNSSSTVLYFSSVPVTQYSDAWLEMLPGSTTPAVIHLDLSGDGYYQTIMPTYPSSGQPTSGSIDVHSLITQMKIDIGSSSIRNRFKVRYINRLSAIDFYYLKNKLIYASYMCHRNTDSLGIIDKELGKIKPRYYRGGMVRTEVHLLSTLFQKLNKAFVDFGL